MFQCLLGPHVAFAEPVCLAVISTSPQHCCSLLAMLIEGRGMQNCLWGYCEVSKSTPSAMGSGEEEPANKRARIMAPVSNSSIIQQVQHH